MKFNFRAAFFIWFTVLCFPFFSFSQYENLRFRKISVEDGLSQSNINSVLMDSRGYVWICTGDGLNLYDGYSFTVFRHDENDPNSIAASGCGDVKEDRTGIVWIGNGGGISSYDPKTHHFFNYLYNASDPSALSLNAFSGFEIDNQNRIWLSGEKGLDMLDSARKKFTHFSDQKNPQAIPAGVVNSICCIKNVLWISVLKKGIFKMNLSDFSVTPEFPDTVDEIRLFTDRAKQLIVIVHGKEMLVRDNGANHFRVFKTICGHGDSVAIPWAAALSQLPDGKLLAGSWDACVVSFSIPPPPAQDSLILNFNAGKFDFKWCFPYIWTDTTGNIWMGGEETELFMGNPYNSKFESYNLVGDRASTNSVWAITTDNKKNAWVCTAGALVKIDHASGKKIFYYNDPENPRSISGRGGFGVWTDSRGRVWSDMSSELNLYNPEADDWTRYKHINGDTNSHPQQNLLRMIEDKSGQQWIGSFGRGIYRFDDKTGKFYLFTTNAGKTNPFRHDVIESMAVNPIDGKIWIGTRFGLFVLDPQTNDLQTIFRDTINQRAYFAITFDKNNNVWMGQGNDGLIKMDCNTKKILWRYTVTDGLPNNYVLGILIDKDGLMWLSTDDGLSCFDPSHESFRNYFNIDGLPGNEFNSGAYHQSEDGKFFFGGMKGVTSFYPGEIKNNPFPPGIAITGFKIFNHEVKINSDSSVENNSEAGIFSLSERSDNYFLPCDISFVKTLDLNYNQNFLTFEFSALHYTAPAKNQYACMLEGFDTKWNELGTRRYASYTNLPPGDYILHVKAANSDGVWNERGISLHIIVRPPFWQTWWFRTLAILSGIFSIITIFRMRTAQLRKRKEELEETVKVRTAEVVAQKEEIQEQKNLVEEKQKEILDSIHYAKRIQSALLPREKFIEKTLDDLKKKKK